MERRILSLFVALALCLTLLPGIARADEIDFGKPQNLNFEVYTGYTIGNLKDQITGLYVNYTHDPRFLEAAQVMNAKGDSQLYGWRHHARVRVDGGEWVEVEDKGMVISNAYHLGSRVTERFTVGYFQPGFARPGKQGWDALLPALVDMSQHEKDSVRIDLENHLIEVQLRYELYNRDTKETLIGEWTDIIAIGKGAEKPEPPSAFPNPPVISDLRVEEESDGTPRIYFNVSFPEEIEKEITNPLGNLMIEAQIRYNDGPWQGLFFEYAKNLRGVDGSRWFRMPKHVNGKDVSVENTKIEVRVKAEWHALEGQYSMESRTPEVESPWSNTLSIGVAPWSNASSWATEELGKADELGLIPDRLRGADLTKPITRAEFAAVSVKVYEALAGVPALPAVTNPFTDCDDIEVLKAYNVGVTVGTSPTEFSPDQLLNREQAATMLTRVFKRVTMPGWTMATDGQFKLSYTQPARFTDDALISDWAKDSVYFMAANGIINGLGDGKFGPRNTTGDEEARGYANATREQALLIAVRMVTNLGSR